MVRDTKPEAPLYLIVQRGQGHPMAWRVRPREIARLAGLMAGILGLGTLGTLFFFRELEANRRLNDRVLAYQLQAELQIGSTTPRMVAAKSGSEAKAEPIGERGNRAPNLVIAPHTSPQFRLVDFDAATTKDGWELLLTLAPTAGAIAEGEALIVLEADVPRIGLSTPGNEGRKRFALYPGNAMLERIDEATIEKANKKKFKFSRALQIRSTFQLGRLYRPVAAHIYFFNAQGLLVSQERKTIESEENRD